MMRIKDCYNGWAFKSWLLNLGFLGAVREWWKMTKCLRELKKRERKLNKFFNGQRDEAMEHMSSFFKTEKKLTRPNLGPAGCKLKPLPPILGE